MIKDVIIDIETEQTVDGNTDTIRFTTDGRFGIKEGSYLIASFFSGEHIVLL